MFFDDTKVLITETSEGALLAQALGGGKAAILRNHGHITVGRTIDEAVCVVRVDGALLSGTVPRGVG